MQLPLAAGWLAVCAHPPAVQRRAVSSIGTRAVAAADRLQGMKDATGWGLRHHGPHRLHLKSTACKKGTERSIRYSWAQTDSWVSSQHHGIHHVGLSQVRTCQPMRPACSGCSQCLLQLHLLTWICCSYQHAPRYCCIKQLNTLRLSASPAGTQWPKQTVAFISSLA